MNLPSVDVEGYDDVFESESESAVQEIENIAMSVRRTCLQVPFYCRVAALERIYLHILRI